MYSNFIDKRCTEVIFIPSGVNWNYWQISTCGNRTQLFLEFQVARFYRRWTMIFRNKKN